MNDLENAFFAYCWQVLPSGCWKWRGPCRKDGYGSFTTNGQRRKAYRYALERIVGRQLQSVEQVLHHCDNKWCVNPIHLRIGTMADNMADKYARNRQSRLSGERNPNSKISPEIAQEIRELFSTGNYSQSGLARHMGLSRDIIRGVVVEGRWA